MSPCGVVDLFDLCSEASPLPSPSGAAWLWLPWLATSSTTSPGRAPGALAAPESTCDGMEPSILPTFRPVPILLSTNFILFFGSIQSSWPSMPHSSFSGSKKVTRILTWPPLLFDPVFTRLILRSWLPLSSHCSSLAFRGSNLKLPRPRNSSLVRPLHHASTSMAWLSLMSTKIASLNAALVPAFHAALVSFTVGLPLSHLRRMKGLISSPPKASSRSTPSITSTRMHHFRSFMYFFFWLLPFRTVWIFTAALVCSLKCLYMSSMPFHQFWIRTEATVRNSAMTTVSTSLTTELYFLVVAASACEP
mmetsp:Transcript_88856/g.272128  ORF Transcript_88856/g.272128 Transcript_88856/m.272128 type:complete len:306 (+) Transcript_88856:448-1365(+)